MKIKVEWPDGSSHTYDTNHAGVQRLADFFSQMYVMGEIELVFRSEGAGDLQCATGKPAPNGESEDIMDWGEQIDLEDAIKELDNG